MTAFHFEGLDTLKGMRETEMVADVVLFFLKCLQCLIREDLAACPHFV